MAAGLIAIEKTAALKHGASPAGPTPNASAARTKRWAKLHRGRGYSTPGLLKFNPGGGVKCVQLPPTNGDTPRLEKSTPCRGSRRWIG